MLNMHGTLEANMVMHRTDVIFPVVARFDDRIINNLAKYCQDAIVLHINIDPASISKTAITDVPIVCDAHHVLEQMLGLLKQGENCQLFAALRDWWPDIK